MAGAMEGRTFRFGACHPSKTTVAMSGRPSVDQHVVVPTRLVKTHSMDTGRNPTSFHVVIPKGVREHMNLTLEQRWTTLAVNDRMVKVPESEASSLRSFAAGIDTTVPRDDDRGRTSSIPRHGSRMLPTRRMRSSSRRVLRTRTRSSFPPSVGSRCSGGCTNDEASMLR